MLVQIVSDIHTEFESYLVRPEAEVLIIAGDLAVGAENVIEWLDTHKDKFKHIIYITGNHEYYNQDMCNTDKLITDYANSMPNVHFLNNSECEIDGKLFYGGTMWTHVNPVEASVIEFGMNDFQLIKTGKSNLTTTVANAIHREFIKGLEETESRIIISHHMPSKQLISPLYENSPLNSAFATNLDGYIASVDTWIFGHTHDVIDTTLYGCRCVCNPKGYPSERWRKEPYKSKLIEV